MREHGFEGAGASGRIVPLVSRLIAAVSADGHPAVDVLVTSEGWVRIGTSILLPVQSTN